MFDLIAFDADDTLWENEAHYEQAREHYHQILKSYPVPVDQDVEGSKPFSHPTKYGKEPR